MIAGWLFLWVALLPVRPGSEGGVQPADAVLLVLLLLLLRRPSIAFAGPGLTATVRWLVLLAGWALLVDGTWLLATGTRDLLLGPFAFVHGALCFAVLGSAAQVLGVARFGRCVASGLTLGLLVVLAGCLLTSRGPSLRMASWFADPNQLAYFALCMAAISSLLRDQGQMPPTLHLLVWPAAASLVLLSASRAGMAGLCVLMLVEFTRFPRALLVFLVLGAVVLSVPAVRHSVLTSSEVRNEHLGSRITQLIENRGYQRLVDHPEHLLLGSGGGYHERFASQPHLAPWTRVEIHSSFFYLAFCYGLIGVALALLAWASFAAEDGWLALSSLGPALVYGIAHNGLRFRAFWLLVVVVAVAISARRAARQRL